jgi:multicomponent Na+:H+ antiporter subunit D
VASAVGIGFSANFITLFLFWEVLTFSAAILIMLKLTPHAISMGFKFIIFHIVGGLLLFTGILQHHAATGSFMIEKPAAGLLFFVLAIGFKAAFLPLHVWVAWGYPAASFPTSVILAGLTTKVGVYAVARILPPDPAIALMGASMAVFGVCCALMQKDMRRLLSYHIISQVGYMVAGAGVAGYYGVDGSMLHVINHMLYKALLFMSAGSVLLVAGTENLHDLTHRGGNEHAAPVWRGVPIAALGALIGALAISGIPPFNGYVSKYLLKIAMSGAGPAEIMLMFASVGTVVSFCKFCYFGFIKGRAHVKQEITASMKAAILIASASCIVLGVYPYLVNGILPYHSKLAVYNPDGIIAALKFLGIGLATFVVLGKVLERGIKPPVWLSAEYLLYALIHRTLFKFCRLMNILDQDLNQLYEASGKSGRVFVFITQMFDGAINETYARSGKLAKRLADGSQALDASLNEAYENSGQLSRRLVDKAAQAEDTLDDLYERSRCRTQSLWNRIRIRPSDWNIKNLNFDSLLVALMLALFLFMLLYYT